MGTVKHLFIVNPVAGRGLALKLSKTIEGLFKELQKTYGEVDYTIEYTKEEGHATELARRYSSKEDYRIYAVGGDGTLNEVLNGMVGTGSSLGCIPGGTGNDFIRPIVSDFDRRKILMNTILGREEEVDVGKVGDRYFINIASLGFDASVGMNVEKFSYFRAIGASAIRFEDVHMRLVVDGAEMVVDAFMMAVANGRCYGGGIPISPESDIQDGYFDVILVQDITRMKIAKFLPILLMARHLHLDEVTVMRAKSIQVFADEPVFLSLDGEIIARKEVHFEMAKEKIRLIVPKNADLKEKRNEEV